MQKIKDLKGELAKSFNMKDLGAATHFLGMQIARNRASRSLKISQQAYIEKLLERFGQLDAREVATPMETGGIPKAGDQGDLLGAQETRWYQALIGSLLYAALMTRPDISFAVSSLGQYCAEPTKTYLRLAVRVLRYLKGIKGS